MVLAGGGGQLGLHLGMHAAACEAGEAPDLLLGTCGGALVAALIHAEPDPARQLAWLAGPEMHRFWCRVRPRPGARLPSALRAAWQRALDRRPAPHLPDLRALALFEAAGPWPSLSWRAGSGTDAVLLGARLLYDPAEAGQPRGARALFQAVAFGPEHACGLLSQALAATGAARHPGSAIAPEWQAVPAASMALADALRISLTDMVYLPPAQAAGGLWLGGAVDLMPLELAARLADEVWAERKDTIPRWTMAPAWRAVLGIDAKRRQQEVDGLPVALRIDTRRLGRHLGPAGRLRERPRSMLGRRFGLAEGALRWLPDPAATAQDYRDIVHAQFDAGRRMMQAALARRPLSR